MSEPVENYGPLKYSWDEFRKSSMERYESAMKELETFFGDKLEAFKRYVERTHMLDLYEAKYTPDLVAKKNGKIYVAEVKANSGIQFLKGEKLKGLMLAKQFGFIPMLVTLNVNIEVSDLTITEL